MVWRFVLCLWSRKHDVVAAIKVASPLGAWVTQDHLLSNTLVRIVTFWNVASDQQMARVGSSLVDSKKDRRKNLASAVFSK
jgi:hypothetical protein